MGMNPPLPPHVHVWNCIPASSSGSLQSAKLPEYNHNKTWCIIVGKNWVGIWRKVNFKHKERVWTEVGGKNPLSSESGPQKPPCARAQPWNQPDPIDSVYLARLQVKAIGNLGEIWRGLWIRRERRKKKMSKKVILSAQQSGKAGVFSDQLLTRLMVIFLHRHRFTVKGPSLHGLSLSFFFFFTPFSFPFVFVLFISPPCDCRTCCCSTSFLFFHAIAVFFGSLSSPATKCSCFGFIQIKQHIF